MQSTEARQKVSQEVYTLYKNTLLHFCLSFKLGSQKVWSVLFQLSIVYSKSFKRNSGEADVGMCMWITSNKEFKLTSSSFKQHSKLS